MSILRSRQRIQAADSKVPIILVVEDDPDNLLLISHILIFLKHNFITASRGQEALELATNYKIDLVLLDLILPDLDGFKLTNRLRQNKLTKKMPILAISALTKQQDRDLAFAIGCNGYLEKPYLIEDLAEIIGQNLPQSFLSHSWRQLISLLKFNPRQSAKLLVS